MKRLLIAALITAALAMPTQAGILFVNSPEGLCVRSIPGTSGDVLQILPYGQQVAVMNRMGNWYRVEGAGYICAEFTQETDPLEDMQYMGEWRITAYTATGFPCANGNYPTAGYTVACNGLPFGTEVYIDGIGFRTVEDRGPSYLGNEWIDVYMSNVVDCINWGDQQMKVWVIDK